MKKALIISLTAFVAIAAGFYLGSRKSPLVTQSIVEPAAPLEVADVPAASAPKTPVSEKKTTAKPSRGSEPDAAQREANPAVATASPLPSLVFDQALGNLLSSQATFVQKQESWKQLRDSGKLDSAITELERRAAANPNSPEYPAVLGQAYLQKAGSIQDLREQGILGLKADQTFEAALNLDASNWEARYWKTTAMSYWPPQMNKGKEVIENYLELVKQQETQAPQPQYALTYVALGEQYEKQGYPDYAAQIWKRGQAIFPRDSALQQKISKAQ